MRLSRRGFLSRFAGWTAAGLAAFAAACSRRTFTGPGGSSGAYGSVIGLDLSPEEILAVIRRTGRPFYHGRGRFYVVRYDTAGPGAEDYVRQGLVAGGLMALYQRCTHLGCRLPFCPGSGQFECPCHNAIFNGAGEYVSGVPPRGMDRFPIRVVDGEVVVDTTRVVPGPSRGFHTMSLEPEGDRCSEAVFPEQS